jgi:hypothetical protein
MRYRRNPGHDPKWCQHVVKKPGLEPPAVDTRNMVSAIQQIFAAKFFIGRWRTCDAINIEGEGFGLAIRL